MSAAEPIATLQEMLEGRLTTAEAARRLLLIAGTGPVSLALDPGALAPDLATRLDQMLPALRWELTKQLVPGRVPDVAYDSPEYHAWTATMPAIRTDRTGVARFLPPEEPA